jgi:hypothetical protein
MPSLIKTTRQFDSSMTTANVDDLQHRCLVGLAGGVLGALAMNTFAHAVNTVSGGREADGAAPGGDRVGRGVQPPQADGRAENDAATRLGTVAYRAVSGSQPSPAARSWLGRGMHYAFSASLGVCYALVARRVPALRAGYGTLYGAAVWMVADEMIVPAMGLSRGPRQLPVGVHAYALAGHLVFGATLEAVMRAQLDAQQGWERDARTT